MNKLTDRIIALARLSLEDPRAATRSLLAENVPLPARTLGLLLMAVASALIAHLSFMLEPPPADPLLDFMIQSPLRTAIVQWLLFAASVLVIFWVGRNFGGHGSLPDTLLVVVWLQVIMTVVQIAALLAQVVSPPIGDVLSLAGLVLSFWLFSSFVAELHGFSSRWAVFGTTLGVGFGIALLIAIMLVLLFGPEAFLRV